METIINWSDIKTGFRFTSAFGGHLVFHWVDIEVEPGRAFVDIVFELNPSTNSARSYECAITDDDFDTLEFFSNRGKFPDKGGKQFFIWLFTGKINQKD